jgi:hypothetical protein
MFGVSECPGVCDAVKRTSVEGNGGLLYCCITRSEIVFGAAIQFEGETEGEEKVCIEGDFGRYIEEVVGILVDKDVI